MEAIKASKNGDKYQKYSDPVPNFLFELYALTNSKENTGNVPIPVELVKKFKVPLSSIKSCR